MWRGTGIRDGRLTGAGGRKFSTAFSDIGADPFLSRLPAFLDMTTTRRKTKDGRFPPAPIDLPPAQRAQWDSTVRAFGADWWKPSDLPLLAEFLRALAMADGLQVRIAATDNVDDLRKLLAARDVEVRRAATLATKLRIAPQSRSDRHLAGRMARDAGGGTKPWEYYDDADRFFDDR